METTIFKIGDPVFDYLHGQGKVSNIGTGDLPVNVEINGKGNFFYTYDGRYHEDMPQMLSFTEYDLVNGGWSQDRSVMNQPKKGDLVYVRNHYDEEWQMKRFHHMNGSICYTGDQFDDSDKPQRWNYYSFENPLLKK